MGRRSILSLSGLGGNRLCWRQDLRMRTNLTGDPQTINFWPAERNSRGEGSCLPSRRIWQSPQSKLPLALNSSIPGQLNEYFRGKLIDSATTPFYRTILMTLYATGLRRAELA